jgi:hypothetical protein
MKLALTDVVDEVLAWLDHLDAAAWVLIGLGLSVAVLTWVGFVGRSRLGAIEVEVVEADGGSSLPVSMAAAQLQDQLGNVGLLPPGGVPAGSPTAGLSAAIEAAPVEQAKWLATLVALLPLPATSRSFKVRATLRTDGAGPRANGLAYTNGLTYSIVDVSSKQCFCMETVWAATPSRAVELAANDIYRTIVSHARDLFPIWAQWTDPDALEHYRKGLACEAHGGADVRERYTQALEHFLTASELDPRNVLARLRIGNCLERLAGHERFDSPARLLRWREALNAYATVIAQHDEIFEPRFRASVVLGVAADHLERTDADARTREQFQRILKTLEPEAPAPNDKELTANMRSRAAALSKEAFKRLGPRWTLVHGGRMRHQFEPTGATRRQLRRALAISRMCLRVRRQWHDTQPIPWGVPALVRMRWRGWIYLRYFRLTSARAGWQAHYNAAAFYALLPEASLQARPTSIDQDGPQNYPVRTGALRRAAFKHLMRAIDDPDNDLRPGYVRHEDPDLRVLRQAERNRWDAAIERMTGPEATVHYRRADNDYDNWKIRVGTVRLLDARTTWYGAPLEHAQVDTWGCVFRIPLYDRTKPLEFQLVHGDVLDGDSRYLIPAFLTRPEIWVRSGDPQLYPNPPAAT